MIYLISSGLILLWAFDHYFTYDRGFRRAEKIWDKEWENRVARTVVHHAPRAVEAWPAPIHRRLSDDVTHPQPMVEATVIPEGDFVAEDTSASRRWVEHIAKYPPAPKDYQGRRRNTVKFRVRQWWTCTTPRDIHAAVIAAETWTEPLVAVIPAPTRELAEVAS